MLDLVSIWSESSSTLSSGGGDTDEGSGEEQIITRWQNPRNGSKKQSSTQFQLAHAPKLDWRSLTLSQTL